MGVVIVWERGQNGCYARHDPKKWVSPIEKGCEEGGGTPQMSLFQPPTLICDPPFFSPQKKELFIYEEGGPFQTEGDILFPKLTT